MVNQNITSQGNTIGIDGEMDKARKRVEQTEQQNKVDFQEHDGRQEVSYTKEVMFTKGKREKEKQNLIVTSLMGFTRMFPVKEELRFSTEYPCINQVKYKNQVPSILLLPEVLWKDGL